MFDLPFDFFSLVIAIVAIIVARKAFNQVAVLRARLDLMETLAAPAPRRPGLRRRHCPRMKLRSRHRPPSQTRIETSRGRGAADSARSGAAAGFGNARARRRFRQPNPASRSASAPAGWSGSAA